jgi:pyruvate formate lyase activating enzyme
MKEALYYEKREEHKVKCMLCPKYCLISEGNKGICHVRKNVNGKLYALSYGKITGYHLDPIEKKPLYNYKKGSMIFSIGSYGCNLTCKFCQNYEIAHNNPRTIDLSIDEIIEKAKEDPRSIGIAYTYNEPLINYEFTLACAKKAKEEGLDNVLVTNGYINEKPFKKLIKYIDAINIDLKAFNNDFYRNICGGTIEEVKKSIILADKETHVEITCLVIDDLNSNQEEILNMVQWIASIDKNIPLHLARYFPRYKMTKPATKVYTLFNLQDMAKKHLNNVYLGNV